jgi:putative membrane protein insertion efficiency factor
MNPVTETEDTRQSTATQSFGIYRGISTEQTLSSFFKRVMVSLIKAYRYWLSPFIPASCRFYPSCSAYALESYQRLGFWKGTYLSLRRILKCNPFHPGGVDPFPGDNVSGFADCSGHSERK